MARPYKLYRTFTSDVKVADITAHGARVEHTIHLPIPANCFCAHLHTVNHCPLLASDEANIAGRQRVLLLRYHRSYIWLQQRARNRAVLRQFLLGRGLPSRVGLRREYRTWSAQGRAAVKR